MSISQQSRTRSCHSFVLARSRFLVSKLVKSAGSLLACLRESRGLRSSRGEKDSSLLVLQSSTCSVDCRGLYKGMISVLFRWLLLSTFTSTDGFLVSKPYTKANSRARTSIQIESSATDFVEPPNPLKTVNFGDPIHSYWGREAFEKTFGVPYVLAPDVYEVSLPKPLGIVFEEILPNAPGVRVASSSGGNALHP